MRGDEEDVREAIDLSVLREMDLLLRGRDDWAFDNASMCAKTACIYEYDREGGNREVRQSGKISYAWCRSGNARCHATKTDGNHLS